MKKNFVNQTRKQIVAAKILQHLLCSDKFEAGN